MTDQEISAKGAREVRAARRVTWLGFFVNAALGVLKILAGIFGRSGAMIADGFHSLSDFFSDIIVLIFVGISRRRANETYQYGHGKYETFATMLLSLFLIAAGVAFLVDGGEKTWRALHGEMLPRPGMIALIMGLVSIAAKEWLFHVTKRVGERYHSAAVIANAWHHRSDSLSSAATVVGIAGAMFLGPHWRVLDPIAAIVVAVFIIIVGIKFGLPAVRELLEVSLPEEMQKEVGLIIHGVPGVKAYHHLRTRKLGNEIVLDFHIKVDPGISVDAAHAIANTVEKHLQQKFGPETIVNIHIEPYRNEIVDTWGRCRD